MPKVKTQNKRNNAYSLNYHDYCFVNISWDYN